MPLRFPSARRAFALTLVLFAAACGSDSTTDPGTPSNPATDTYAASLGVNIASMTKISDDLYIQDLVVGTGDAAANGRIVRMTYTGWTVNGSQFDSNVGGTPFPVTIGVSNVITGWHLGIVGMKLGGKRKLVIGSNLAYGPGGNPPIPGNATIVFDVQLVGIQ